MGQLGVVVGLSKFIHRLQLWQRVERQGDGGEHDEQDGHNGQDLEKRRESKLANALCCVGSWETFGFTGLSMIRIAQRYSRKVTL